MKTKIFFTLLFLSLTINAKAQDSDLIAGKWVFKKALNKEVDEAGQASLKAEVIDKWKLVFQPDGIFETYIMGEKAVGKWKLSEDGKHIILSGTEIGPSEFTILRSTQDELVLKLGLGEFLLKRIQ